MVQRRQLIGLLGSFLLILSSLSAQSIQLKADKLESMLVSVSQATWKGQDAIRVLEKGDGDNVAIVPGTSFTDGTIELEVAGTLAKKAPETARGFIGVAFRLQKKDTLRYDCFYLRPLNARADNQVQRNHSTQYVSHPDYPWYKLREEFPKMYESYVDMAPGEWTKMKVVVKDKRAELYVNGAEQPCLIVKDLKGPATGAIALWVGLGTDGYFRNLKVTAPKR